MSDQPDERAQARAAARGFAIRAAIAKLAELVNHYYSAKAEEEHGNRMAADAQARMAAAIEQHKQLHAMAELFEFDLDREYDAHWARQINLPRSDDKGVGRPATEMNFAAALAEADKPKTIKERVIEAAQQAHPLPIRASRLRRQLGEIGIRIHEKTIGMTLYRLSRENILRREGWDWFFVPEDQRQLAAPQDEESPGSEPGLLLEAAE